MCDGYVRSLSNGQNPLPGTIINIASQMGFDEFPARSAYGVSKHAVVKLAQFVHAGQYSKFPDMETHANDC
jgi:short-subunit dehydrogenase